MDGLSCLLLIRDEGGCPDKQLSLWADGIIFVFSLEKDDSLEVVNEYYQQMSSFRTMTDVPILLVGTQGRCFWFLRAFGVDWRGVNRWVA